MLGIPAEEEAIADAFWLMESFGGNGDVCIVLGSLHAEACWRGLDAE